MRLESLFSQPAARVAPRLLGSVLVAATEHGTVALRLSELEAYGGPRDSQLPDPGAHTYGGRTARNATMFGSPARLYVYISYGLHHALNFVCRPEEDAGGVLVRAGEVVWGIEAATRRRRARRRSDPPAEALARGPGTVGQALGIELTDDGAALRDLGTAPDPVARVRHVLAREPVSSRRWFGLALRESAVTEIAVSPRTGVSGRGGSEEFPWRFAIPADPTVSPYRRAVPRRRNRSGELTG